MSGRRHRLSSAIVRTDPSPSTDTGDYEFHHRVRIRFAETDAMGIVHHSRYLPLLEEARVAYLRQIDHPYTSIQDEGIEMAVLEAHLQYRQVLRFDDLVDVWVSLSKVERATFQMSYLLTVAGEVCATASTAHGCITPDGRPTRLPAWFRALGGQPRPADARIANDVAAVVVSARDGGRVVQITVDGIDLLIGRADAPEPDNPLAWGSYPMVPYAGRVRRGRFEFDGSEYLLPINLDNHAIHGMGFDRPWTLTHHDDTTVELAIDFAGDARWPFGGTATQRIAVDADGVEMTLAVTAGDRPMPASIGWHPWFRKPQALVFQPSAMYRRDADYLPTGELIPVPDGPWDDCFANDQPVLITIDGVTMRLSSACTEWVVYDMPPHATCVEPQTAPPDAFTLRPHRLAPGETLRAVYRIDRVVSDAT